MTSKLKAIEDKIDSISNSTNSSSDAIMDSILNFLTMKYESQDTPSIERAVIETVKLKILSRTQQAPDSMFFLNPYSISEVFSLDSQEIKYYKRAFNELDADGYIHVSANLVSLTDKAHNSLKGLY